ncbi:MAG: hypothetical protein H0X37_07260 [Herpetosiphonaceae bacterium]|nr:hypothetical protein [Herpetosiphonaceae bacterium]
MTTPLHKELTEQLRKAQGQGEVTVEAQAEDVTVVVDMEHCDRYAGGIRQITVRPDAPLPDVGTTAGKIAEHINVIDPLQVVEVEGGEGRAILRTTDPETDQEGVTYWEATVTPDATTLQRFHKEHSEPDRAVVDEPLLHRELGSLVDQVAEALEAARE